jgi:hypothetical protein
MKNKKISISIKSKATTKKLIMLRIKAILNGVIKKDYPYVTIEKIKIDFFNIPIGLNQEYKETLKEQRGILENEYNNK